jgi:hypothetical protein
MNVVQGSNAVLSFYKNGFLPFVCASTVNIGIDAAELPVRTIKTGAWKKVTYGQKSYAITLSGVLVYDSSNFSGWDMMDNLMTYAHVTFLLSFTHQDGTIKSLQGTAMVKKTSLAVKTGDVVKNDFELSGSGDLMYFNGLVPCPSAILTVTVGGQTAGDGIARITYTYNGPLYQVKYRVDAIGNWGYASVGTEIDIANLSLGTHSVELVPVCANGYEGAPFDQSFTMTQGLTCGLTVTSLTPTVTNANCDISVAFNTAPGAATLKYSVDGGAYQYINTPLSNPYVIHLTGLPIGSHSINVIPICANGVQGTGATQNFTITSNSTNSVINWSTTIFPPGSLLQIFKNGILVVSQTTTSAGGSFNAVTTDTIRAVLSTTGQPGRNGTLTVTDTTTSATLHSAGYNTGGSSSTFSDSYSFSPSNGDTYSISGIVGP